MPKKKTTLKDVAGALGVSSGLVSYVLNGRGDEMRISKEMQKRVVDMARVMNYQTNIHAKRIRENEDYTPLFSFFWPYSINTEMLNACFAGFHDVQAVEKQQFDLVMQMYDTHQLDQYKKNLHAGRTNGAIIFMASDQDRRFVEETTFNMPLVLLNHQSKVHSHVYMDRMKLVKQLADLIVKAGYERIGVLGGMNFPSHRVQVDALVDELTPQGVYIHPASFRERPVGEKSGAEALREMIAESGRPPQLMVTFSARIARGVGYALRQAGYSCPRDMHILTVVDNFQRMYSEFGEWSVIQYPIDRMCAWAVNKLLESTSAPGVLPEAKEFAAEFFLQDSFFRR